MLKKQSRLIETRMNNFNQQIKEVDENIFRKIDTLNQTEKNQNTTRPQYNCWESEENTKTEWLANFETMKTHYEKEMVKEGKHIFKITTTKEMKIFNPADIITFHIRGINILANGTPLNENDKLKLLLTYPWLNWNIKTWFKIYSNSKFCHRNVW